MDLQALVNQFKFIAGVYAFDILPDGSYSEIRIMAINDLILIFHQTIEIV